MNEVFNQAVFEKLKENVFTNGEITLNEEGKMVLNPTVRDKLTTKQYNNILIPICREVRKDLLKQLSNEVIIDHRYKLLEDLRRGTPIECLGSGIIFDQTKNNSPLSNLQINEYYKDNDKYAGFCLLSDLNNMKSLEDDEFRVILIDRDLEDDIMGHFVALYAKNDVEAYYFDSYGVRTPEQVKMYMEPRVVSCNTRILQNINSNLCGYYCLYVLDMLQSTNKNIKEVCKIFKQHPYNKNNVNILLKHFKDEE